MSEAKAPAPASASPAPAGGGGIKALLPLILTVVLMPVLAFLMTQFVIVPKLQKATVQARAGGEPAEAGKDGHGDAGEDNGHGAKADDGHGAKKDDGHGAKKDDGHGAKKDDGHGAKKDDGHGAKKDDGHGPKKDDSHGKSSGNGKPSAQFGKVLVNVAGSLGARFLMTNFTLIGAKSDLKDKIEDNRDQLMDVTIGILRAKNLQDLEKPGASNFIRTEIIGAFNAVLGSGAVKELYFTEFAIQ